MALEQVAADNLTATLEGAGIVDLLGQGRDAEILLHEPLSQPLLLALGKRDGGVARHDEGVRKYTEEHDAISFGWCWTLNATQLSRVVGLIVLLRTIHRHHDLAADVATDVEVGLAPCVLPAGAAPELRLAVDGPALRGAYARLPVELEAGRVELGVGALERAAGND